MLLIIRRFQKDKSGTQMIEFVMIAPILIILILGTIEIGRYILIHQKVSRTAYTLGNLVTQLDPLSRQDVSDMFTIANNTLSPFDITPNQLIQRSVFYITAVNYPSGGTGATRQWSCSLGDSTLVANPGQNIISGKALTLQPKEGAYSVEVVYNYTPIFVPSQYNGYFRDTQLLAIRSSTVIRPRRSSLTPAWTLFQTTPLPRGFAPGVHCSN
ncbi:MAG: TadE/TadG family type IV pilus assembly protein [Holosporales bacterium]|jgi:Flp pilus assembly pilin Flp